LTTTTLTTTTEPTTTTRARAITDYDYDRAVGGYRRRSRSVGTGEELMSSMMMSWTRDCV
jgi:hypothetical protein